MRHSALRLPAMSGKTVVIDEAHALSPVSHLKLLRLLNWLGASNCPVVQASFAPGYPRWLFADAATATGHRMSRAARDRHRTLASVPAR